jgi:hypothetical protein
MKQLPLCLLFIFCYSIQGLNSQNIQLHYDFGNSIYTKEWDGRPVLTSTVEMFKPDKWGNTFFFIDMDYKSSEGIVSGYWEIARELTFWKPPFSVHVEYNGGLTKSFPFQNAYLGGLTYTCNKKNFTKGYTLAAMYKHIQKNNSPHNFQLTATWYLHFGKNGICTFTGFVDWWREKTSAGDFIFMSEPQFWMNLNKLKWIDDGFNLSVGGETELTCNFAGHDGFYTIPTLAVKWIFN